jgi:hypothetical protein
VIYYIISISINKLGILFSYYVGTGMRNADGKKWALNIIALNRN